MQRGMAYQADEMQQASGQGVHVVFMKNTVIKLVVGVKIMSVNELVKGLAIGMEDQNGIKTNRVMKSIV